MRGCIVFGFERILAEDINQPLFDQHVLYRALATEYRTVVLSTSLEYDVLRRFLRQHGLRYDLIMVKGESALDDVSWKVAQVREIKGKGWPVEYVIDADLDTFRLALAEGTPALLLAHRAQRPLWLPENRETRAWADVEAFLDKERDQRSATSP